MLGDLFLQTTAGHVCVSLFVPFVSGMNFLYPFLYRNLSYVIIPISIYLMPPFQTFFLTTYYPFLWFCTLLRLEVVGFSLAICSPPHRKVVRSSPVSASTASGRIIYLILIFHVAFIYYVLIFLVFVGFFYEYVRVCEAYATFARTYV